LVLDDESPDTILEQLLMEVDEKTYSMVAHMRVKSFPVASLD